MMDIKNSIPKISSLDTKLDNSTNNGIDSKLKSTVGPSFKETLNKTAINSFDLKKEIPTLNQKIGIENFGIKFSNHAIDRMQSRGISFKPEDLSKLNEAVDKAASKGSKDSLILMNESALIVSVKNRTVVTVMDKTALKENVFTNIDSTIVM